MVGVATLLIVLAAWFAAVWYRKRDLPGTKWFLRAVALSGIATVVALECGWIVTEVGRQPWIVNGYMRTSQAVTPAKGIWWIFGLTMALYATLALILIVVLRALSRRWRADQPPEGELPYSPPPAVPPREASA
jgi:cytochrome d ubiquinol oxidase subunit I